MTWRPRAAFAVLLLSFSLLAPSAGFAAEGFDLSALLPNNAGSMSGRMIQLLGALTILSVAPGLLVMVTSFTRFAIALSFLRAGLGLQSTPANLVMISLALFMTFYVMGPSAEKAWETGGRPLVEGKIGEAEAFNRISAPFREFMLANVREKDLRLFSDLRKVDPTTSKDGPRLDILVPAFMTSELRRGFEIGFLIVVPFLAIDIIVAVITMSMGMMMLPPTTIALPAKVLFFILIDGWNLLVGSLIRSYG
jgi:flagellar biosynthesis protein FliP